jgi:FMN phosphatase YigB (HAD superfamily)
MKIIFLDFDGVLCTVRSHVAQGSAAPRGVMEALDREGVGLLNALMVQHRQSVRAVISSTWRLIHEPQWIENHLRRYGWEGQLHHAEWATPQLSRHESSRGAEIADWLSRHPEVERYVIIDDNPNMLESQQPFFVRTVATDGLSWNNFLQAMSILHGAVQQSEAAE